MNRELTVRRRSEAERAGSVLGIHELQFLDANPGSLDSDIATAMKLREALQRIRPAIVYLPFFLDRHPDHRATSDILLRATDDTALSFECRAYEVWTPLFPNCIVRIDETVELKKAALACYESQLAHTDFLHLGLGLNAYRSSAIANGGARYAEAFYASSLADYRELYGAFRRSTQHNE